MLLCFKIVTDAAAVGSHSPDPFHQGLLCVGLGVRGPSRICKGPSSAGPTPSPTSPHLLVCVRESMGLWNLLESFLGWIVTICLLVCLANEDVKEVRMALNSLG